MKKILIILLSLSFGQIALGQLKASPVILYKTTRDFILDKKANGNKSESKIELRDQNNKLKGEVMIL